MTTQLHTAARMALDALIGVLDDAEKVVDLSVSGGVYEGLECKDAITALREAIAAPMPEPVALMALDDINELMHCNGMSVFVENPRIYPPYCEGEPLVGFVPLYFAPPAAPAPVVPDGVKPVGYTDPFYLQVKQIGGFSCQYECFGQFTTPLYAAPVVREPLTDEQLEGIVAATGHGSALFDFARAIEAHHGIGITGGGK